MTTTTRKSEKSIGLIVVVVLVIGAIVGLVLALRPATREVTLGLTDGMVVQVDDGLVYFMWDGAKQRIQQPAPLSDADLEELGLEIGEPAPELLTLGEEGSYFATYPFEGSEATLYLVQDGKLHEVQIVEATLDQVVEIPDLSPLVINRVRIPEVSTQ
jgi:hypothetical protein